MHSIIQTELDLKSEDTFLDLILLFASDLALKKSHKLPEAQAFFHL